MSHTAATPDLQATPRDVGEPPCLSPRLRFGAALASALISVVVLTSVVLGITATPELVGQLVALPAAAANA